MAGHGIFLSAYRMMLPRIAVVLSAKFLFRGAALLVSDHMEKAIHISLRDIQATYLIGQRGAYLSRSLLAQGVRAKQPVFNKTASNRIYGTQILAQRYSTTWSP
jgi:hypothetical protein